LSPRGNKNQEKNNTIEEKSENVIDEVGGGKMDFMRQISITDCDSPKRQSIMSNYKEFNDDDNVNNQEIEKFNLGNFRSNEVRASSNHLNLRSFSRNMKKMSPSMAMGQNKAKSDNSPILKVNSIVDKLMLRHGGKY